MFTLLTFRSFTRIIVSGSRSSSPASSESYVAVSDMVLNYWVHGDLSYQSASIEISRTQTVDSLQKALKAENSVGFSDVESRDLVLYKASLTRGRDENSFESILRPLTISRLGKPLGILQTLSDLFEPFPSDDTLSFIVVPKCGMPIQCWMRGAKLANSFKVQTSTRVGDLKNAIKAMHDDLADVSPDCLKLYKIPICDEPALCEILNRPGSGQLLQEDEWLDEVFDDVPFSRVPRAVVEPNENHHDPIVTARNAFLMSAEVLLNDATPSDFQTQQRKSMLWGISASLKETIPTTLLHPVFCQFVKDCETITHTAVDNRFTYHITDVMCDLYGNKHERFRAVNREFQDYNVHFTVSQSNSAGYDAKMSVNGHQYVIVECYNESGDIPLDPFSKPMQYYVKSTRNSALKFNRSPLPCILVVIFGPHISFAAAAWNLRPTVQGMSMPIAFHYHPTAIDMQYAAARYMVAFRKAMEGLKEYYENLQETPLPAPSAPVPVQIFPYPRSYHDGHVLKTFHYLRHLDEKQLIFLGTEGESGDRICVKFVQSYGRSAHECLARLGYAPGLRGVEKVTDDWSIVIMDVLEGYKTLSTHETPLPASVSKNIIETLTSLHDAGYVHGDIRDTSIMVSRKDEKFMIVNFDFAGKIGEARYPWGVYYDKNVARPEGASFNKEILVAHDEFMLARIPQLGF